ncbi:MAG: hypothetical protein ABL867_05975 [Rickettsiales bacterium]
MEKPVKYPENIDKYPHNVRDIIRNDILKRGVGSIALRDEKKIIRRAYLLAVEFHDGQTRKGLQKPDYITHPLQVYDMVHKCIGDNEKIPDRSVLLAAALLHDGIEDYKKDEVKKYLKLIEAGKDPKTMPESEAGINPLVARQEAINKVREAFPNKEFADKLLKLIDDVTNPIDYSIKDGKLISKTKWQSDKIKNASMPAKLIKICDKTMSSVSNIEEVPNWNYDKVRNNLSQSSVVVMAAQENVNKNDIFYPSIEYAAKVFNLVERGSMEILTQMIKSGAEIPPKEQFASFTFKIIDEMIRTGNTDQKSLNKLGR